MAERNTKISKVDAIYGLILDKIQSRELLPGDRLNIEDLARDFGVSRTPVRETVNRLIQEGFVEQKHNVGPSVVQLSDEQAQDLIEANAALGGLVFDSFGCLKDLQGLQSALQEVMTMQLTASECGDDRRFHEASVGFHKVLIEHCTNPIIRDYAMKTQNQINMCNFAYMATKENHQQSLKAHSEVNEAVQNGELKKARKLMERHNKFEGTIFFQGKKRNL